MISAEGEQLGLMPIREARDAAIQKGLDLVEVAPNSDPPVCRIMDFGKFKYEASKKEQGARKKGKTFQLKEIKLRPHTDEHDLGFKTRNLKKFLAKKNRVKVTVVFRGREMAYISSGEEILKRIAEEVVDIGTVEQGHRASLGYYAQEHEQIEDGLTVLDHLRAVSTEPDSVLRGILGHFLLADKIEQEGGTLSGGEKTKLALAQLVMGRHNVLLLDEPTNNLDPQAKQALLGALRRYTETVVLVSHDTDFVAALGPDRAVLMPEAESAYFDDSMLDLVALA